MLEIQNSLQAYEAVRVHYNPYVEEIWTLALNSQLQLVGKEMIFRGTVDSCPLHPRDIFRFLIMKNATSFILIHNHPSNSVDPSSEDISVTGTVHNLGELLEIKLVDHLIIGLDKYYSFADFGILRRATETPRHHCQKAASDPTDCESE